MTNQKLFISRITQLSEEEISSVLSAVTLMLEAKELAPNSVYALLLRLPIQLLSGICLGEVSEFDKTFVLDCNKGRELESTVNRTPRRHSAKAEKRGISNEYICICTVKDCNNRNREDSCFYNLNAVNGFHSFIKQRHEFYRRVASKYINRYNALFSTTYRNAKDMIRRLMDIVLAVTSSYYYNIHLFMYYTM